MPRASNSAKNHVPVRLVPVSGSLIPELPEAPDLNPLGIPEPPTRLVGSPRKSWDMFCKILNDAGVLRVSDGVAVAMMVEAWEEIQECQQHIKAYGRVYEIIDGGGNRRLCANPACGMLAQADRRLRAYLLDFGLTPSGRRYIAPESPGIENRYDPLAEFLRS